MTTTPGDQQSADAIREFHGLLADDELAPGDTELGDDMNSDEPDDEQIGDALRQVAFDAMSPEAGALLLRLTDYNENIEPPTRQRLVVAAQRGLQRHREESGSLPVLMFARRREARVDLDDLAAQAGISKGNLIDVEAGRTPLLSVDPGAVAAWITALDIEFDRAEAALRASFEHRVSKPRAAEASPAEAPNSDELVFIHQVLSHLRNLQTDE